MELSYWVASVGWFRRPLDDKEQKITEATLSHRIYSEWTWNRNWTATAPVGSQDPAQYLGQAPPSLLWARHVSSLVQHLCPCVCLPITGQSLLRSVIPALEETSLSDVLRDHSSFWGKPFILHHSLGVVVTRSVKGLALLHCHSWFNWWPSFCKEQPKVASWNWGLWLGEVGCGRHC